MVDDNVYIVDVNVVILVFYVSLNCIYVVLFVMFSMVIEI